MINTAWEDGIGVNTEFGVVFGAVFLVRLVGKAALIFVFNDNQNLRHFWNFEKIEKCMVWKFQSFVLDREIMNMNQTNAIVWMFSYLLWKT